MHQRMLIVAQKSVRELLFSQAMGGCHSIEDNKMIQNFMQKKHLKQDMSFDMIC